MRLDLCGLHCVHVSSLFDDSIEDKLYLEKFLEIYRDAWLDGYVLADKFHRQEVVHIAPLDEQVKRTRCVQRYYATWLHFYNYPYT